MVSDSNRIRWSSEWTAVRPITRTGLRMGVLERKWLLIAMDLILLNSALLASVVLWNEFPLSAAGVADHLKWFITISVAWVIIGTALDVYNLARAASVSAIVASAGSAALVTSLIYLAIPWLTPPILHRSYAMGLVGLSTGAILVWRVFYSQTLVQGPFRQRALVVGGAEAATELMKAVQQAGQGADANPFRGTGYEIVGRVGWTEADAPDGGPHVLGDVRRLVRLARQWGVDEVILASVDEHDIPLEDREVLLDCRELGMRVSSLASVYERLTGRLPAEHGRYDTQLLLSPDDSPAFRLYSAAKRAIDIIGALLGLLALGLALPFVALANAIGSPGPLFYRQERLGKGGRPFTVVKLRSMIPDAERATGAVWCGVGDPRITAVGRWLRKSRLDELPQVINVLRGEMSIVGPRPERPSLAGLLARDLPLYRVRHAVRPGLTGWAQVHQRYALSIEDARVKLGYDLFYVKHASLYLDLLCMLHTVRIVIGLRGH